MKWRKRIRLGATIETVWKVLKKLELPHDPATPLLGTHLGNNSSLKRYMHPVECAALFAIAKKQKQPKRPSADKRNKNTRSTYSVESYSATKKG